MGARGALGVITVAALLGLTACGTRLPNTAFVSGDGQVTTTVGGTSGDPTADASGATGGSGGTPRGVSSSSSASHAPAGLPGALPGVASTAGTGAGLPTVAPVPGAAGKTRAQAAPTASGKAGRTTPAKSTGTSKAGAGSSAAAAANPASDRGVTADRIEIGNIVSSGGEFGAYEFTPNYYGAAAYFANLNAHGGVNGRLVDFKACPDGGDADSDVKAVHTCIDADKVFAFAGNNVFDYAGSSYVQSSGVPDVGGEPVSNVYDADSHLYSISGDSNPRSGNPGYADGKAWSGSQVGTFFKKSVGVSHLGVVYYDESDSQRGASEIAGEFSNAGVATSSYAVNLGLPNFAAAVSQMQADGVDAVADELDEDGNQKLCQAIEQNPTFFNQLKAKISTEASWTSRFQSDFSSTPNCRAKSFATGLVANYDDTSNPGVAAFRAAYTMYFGSNSPYLAEWALHGWVSAMWLTDAMTSCGANLTRACVETYLNRNTKYGAGGLLDPSSFVSPPESSYTAGGSASTDCISAAQWSDANGGHWLTRADLVHNCYTTPWYSYSESG